VGELPDYVGWPIFPFEGDLRVKEPLARMATDVAREGEAGRRCRACARADDDYVWVDERWRLTALEKPTALPVAVILETRRHMDLGEFDDDDARELGSMILRLERAIHRVGGIGRVHVNRWGDGGSHFHLWFLARPVGVLELYGFGMPLWYQILPPIDDGVRDANLRTVAEALAVSDRGGRSER
jgi:diadenosine tetraphosphate (Ap4A) HIT family hydrolase